MTHHFRPLGAIPPGPTRAFLALLAEHQAHPSVTVREVQRRGGWRSMRTVWDHLDRLRVEGLVSWEPRKAGTLRPLLRRVA